MSAKRQEDQLKQLYTKVKNACAASYLSDETHASLLAMVNWSLNFLENKCELIELTSGVAGKEYITYRYGKLVARPANSALFNRNTDQVLKDIQQWFTNRKLADTAGKSFYTAALAPCLALELFDRNNKKGPATYFECLIGHIMAKSLGEEPYKEEALKVDGTAVRMTMDFLFKQTMNNKAIHLAVKMSTRERVVQAWSQQRILDAAFGLNHHKGVLISFSETKLNSKTLEVVEICVPEQWLVYQSYLAKMDQILFFDLPERYRKLCEDKPKLFSIRSFGDAIPQIKEVLK